MGDRGSALGKRKDPDDYGDESDRGSFNERHERDSNSDRYEKDSVSESGQYRRYDSYSPPERSKKKLYAIDYNYFQNYNCCCLKS